MIVSVEKEDIENLNNLSKTAIVESVDATEEIKCEVIEDTCQRLVRGFSSKEHVFAKYIDNNNEILGFILICDAWNLSDLFVDPKAHGRGIGKALFHYTKAQVIQMNNRGYIRANSSTNAEGFYRKLGFVDYVPDQFVPSFVVPLIYNL